MSKSTYPNLTQRAKAPLVALYRYYQWLAYRGKGRWCPICKQESRRFAPGASINPQEVRCIHCGAQRRHRFAWLYLNEHTNLFDGTPKSMLHNAPEPCLEQKLRDRLQDGYLTADLMDPAVMVKMDITAIQYADESFDAIFCSHVLEHVVDDRKALQEFRRVLKPHGWLLLMVPITASATYEDPAIVSPSDRLRHFGQADHVRKYGADFAERVREAGLHVTTFTPRDLYPVEQIERMGLGTIDEIYYCTPA